MRHNYHAAVPSLAYSFVVMPQGVTEGQTAGFGKPERLMSVIQKAQFGLSLSWSPGILGRTEVITLEKRSTACLSS